MTLLLQPMRLYIFIFESYSIDLLVDRGRLLFEYARFLTYFCVKSFNGGNLDVAHWKPKVSGKGHPY